MIRGMKNLTAAQKDQLRLEVAFSLRDAAEYAELAAKLSSPEEQDKALLHAVAIAHTATETLRYLRRMIKS